MMSDFEYDCWQRKRLAQQAKYRKCGSKSKKCSMSTDHMTQKQWKERNGKVVTVNLNQPITWDEFKALTTSMQEEYLRHMMENYGANATSFAAMFGVQPLTIRRHIQMNKLNIKFPVGHSMSTARRTEARRQDRVWSSRRTCRRCVRIAGDRRARKRRSHRPAAASCEAPESLPS